MPTKTVNGVTMSYDDRGTGRPVVLLHAFPVDRRMWAGQLADLSADHRVVTPDFRGFGQSIGDRPFSIEDLADDVHALLKEIGALPCVLGGLSMGGYVAMAFARKYPADLMGLILLDTRAEADDAKARDGRAAAIDSVRKGGAKAIADQMVPKLLAPGASESKPDVAGQVRAMIEACPPMTIERALAALRDRPDSSDSLRRVRVPTLIVVGEGDQVTPPTLAETMRQLVPGAALVTIPGAGHLSPVEQPGLVSEAIRSFSSRIRD